MLWHPFLILHLLYQLLIEIRIRTFQRQQLPVLAHKTVAADSISAKLSCLGVCDRIMHRQFNPIKAFDEGPNFYRIIKMNHRMVFCLHLQNGTDDSHIFNVLVRTADFFKKVNSCLLKPANIVGMMNNPHLVCFIILCFMCIEK